MKTNEHGDYVSPQVVTQKCQLNCVILDSSPDNGGIEKTKEESWMSWWDY